MNKDQKQKITISSSLLFLLIAILGLVGVVHLIFVVPKRLNSSTVILNPTGCSMIRLAAIPTWPFENGCRLEAYVDHGSPGLLTIIHNNSSGTARTVSIPSTSLIGIVRRQ